jgi:hypothetical protein
MTDKRDEAVTINISKIRRYVLVLPFLFLPGYFECHGPEIYYQTNHPRTSWGSDSLMIGGMSGLRKAWYITKKRRRQGPSKMQPSRYKATAVRGESDFVITV